MSIVKSKVLSGQIFRQKQINMKRRKMKLYDYQENILNQAIEILDEHNIVYLAAAMRVGKTPIAIHLIGHTHSSPKDVSLVLTKKLAMQSIEKDIDALGDAFTGQIEVCSYHSIHKLDPKQYKTIVLDESHTLGAYPKTNKMQKQVAVLKSENYVLLSGTPNIESHSQLFHQFRVTGKVFLEYKNFYSWFKEYGVPKQKMVRGRMINEYTNVKKDMLLADINKYFVTFTQEQAKFKVKSELKPIYLSNPEVSEWIKVYAKNSVCEFKDYIVASDGSASILSKCLQVCGGTVLDDEDKSHILYDGFNPFTKADWIKNTFQSHGRVCIFTNFIHERHLLMSYFEKDITANMDAFLGGDSKYFVGSLESYCEGFDLSKVEDLTIVIYSLSWKGRVLSQSIERQNNKLREKPIDVYLPLIKDTPEIELYRRVAVEKMNFNSTFFNSVKGRYML